MRNRAQVIFDPVHVPAREAPIVFAQIVEAGQAITLNPAGAIDVLEKLAQQAIRAISCKFKSSVLNRIANMAPDMPITRPRLPDKPIKQ